MNGHPDFILFLNSTFILLEIYGIKETFFGFASSGSLSCLPAALFVVVELCLMGRKLKAERAKKKRVKRVVDGRLKTLGVNLIRDFNNIRIADLNFYTSDCQIVRHFRTEIIAIAK